MIKSLNFTKVFLLFVLLAGLFVRIYRVDQILGFYFDQGRDANVIWDLIHNGNFFLIGPTTGIEGIFRGPWYYWLITPFYFLSKGSPILPAVFLASTTIVAVFILYKLGKKLGGIQVGVLAAIIGSFSYIFVNSARWLSNPTPMYLISMLTVYCLYMCLKGKQIYWILTAFLWAMAMQFGSAAEVFYFPSIIIFAILNRKYFPSLKTVLFSALAVLIVFLPQIIFDARNDGILSGNVRSFIFEEGSFALSFWEVVKIRVPFYLDILMNKLFPLNRTIGNIFLVIALASLILNFKSLWQNKIFQIIFLFTFTPFIGMIFFQGNEGNVYDYYFTGYFFVHTLLFCILFVSLFRQIKIQAIFLSVFLIFFLSQNLTLIVGYLTASTDGESSINFENQKEAIEWIYEDAKDEFNVDVYVPPVIPHAYDYLLKWYPTTKNPVFVKEPGIIQQTEKNVPVLYTLYEADPPHPERLNAWLNRQKGIAAIEEEERFGGITVQRRKRFQ